MSLPTLSSVITNRVGEAVLAAALAIGEKREGLGNGLVSPGQLLGSLPKLKTQSSVIYCSRHTA